MAKRNVTIISKALPIGQGMYGMAEVISAVCRCQYKDDADTNNDTIFSLSTDYKRYRASVTIGTSQPLNNVKNKSFMRQESLAGEKQGFNQFLLNAPVSLDIVGARGRFTKTVDGKEVVSPEFMVISLDSTVITVRCTQFGTQTSFAVPEDVTAFRIDYSPITRGHIQIVPRIGMYGGLVQYKIKKKLPISGYFNFHAVEISGNTVNVDPEFSSKMSQTNKSWGSEQF